MCFLQDWREASSRSAERIAAAIKSNSVFIAEAGTGTGKTCTAIQIAEEYILRPEYQDKRVLVLASAWFRM